MHRKRVTSELHDSYFRLMTIKHSISKIQWAIVWALNYYIIELSWVPKQLPADFQTSRDQMWWWKPHPTEGALGKAPMVWIPRHLVEHVREQERHNVTVITVGSKYEVYVRSPAPSHMQILNNPFEPCNKVRGEYILLKKSSMRRLFMRLSLILCRCDVEWTCK